MNKILLLMQGHTTAQSAAKFAIDLAKRLEVGVVVEYTIDREKIFDIEEFTGQPALCGSAAFVQAEELIVQALTELAESMMTFFSAICEGRGVPCEQFIESGKPADLLAARAHDCSMIVVPAAAANIKLAKALIDQVACPIAFLSSEVVLLMPNECDGNARESVLAALEDTGRPIWIHHHIEEDELFKFVPKSSCLDDVTYSLMASHG